MCTWITRHLLEIPDLTAQKCTRFVLENADQYLPPEEYVKKDNPGYYWTIQIDDRIVLGECDKEIEKPADLAGVRLRHCKVLSWSDNRFGGLPHWRIGGA